MQKQSLHRIQPTERNDSGASLATDSRLPALTDALELSGSGVNASLSNLLETVRTFRSRNLSTDDSRLLKDQLIDVLEAHLLKHGISHRVIKAGDSSGVAKEFVPAIELLPDQVTTTGKIVAGYSSEFQDLSVYISATLCVDHGNCCIFSRGFVNQMYLQPQFVLNPEKPGSNFESNLLLQHEIGHARHRDGVQRNYLSPYYGCISCSAGNIPELLGLQLPFGGTESYLKSFHIDEIRQYAEDERMISKDMHSEYYENAPLEKKEFYQAERHTKIVNFSLMTIGTIDKLMHSYTQSKSNVNLSISSSIVDNVPTATLTEKSSGLKVEVPVLQTDKNYEHPESYEALGKQLKWERDTAAHHLCQSITHLLDNGYTQQLPGLSTGASATEIFQYFNFQQDLSLAPALRERSGLQRTFTAIKDSILNLLRPH